MKTHKINRVMRAMFIVAGILALHIGPVSAQGQTGKQTTSSPSGTQNQTAVEKDNAGMNTGATDKAVTNSATDDMFIKKVSELNLAEIEMSRMAIKQDLPEEVNEYAMMLIDHHTTAQIELSTAVSKSMAKQGNQTVTEVISNDANEVTSIESENNDADKMATLGGTGGTTGSTMARGKTNGKYNSNIDTGNSDNANSKVDSTTDTSKNTNGTTSSSGNTTSTTGNATSTTGSMNLDPSLEQGYLPSELSAEHKALINKLSILSGEEFKRLYLQAMIEDHAKAIELFEKQALQSKDTNLQTFASRNLANVKEHYVMAQKLSGNAKTSTPSSGNKATGSK